jgi:23S rRNA (guanosine2251-2'-O)-methyltransferase
VHTVLAWLQAQPTRLRRVCYERRARQRLRAVCDAAAAAGVAIEAVEAPTLRAMVGSVRHQGVVAEAGPFPYADLDAVLSGAPTLLVAADQIQDPQNLGALMRTVDAVGAGGLLIPREAAAPVTPAVEVASAGGSATVPVCRVVNLGRALDQARRRGYWIVGLETAGGADALRFDPPGAVVVVVGGEAGMRPGVRRRCQVQLSIPMWGQVESLNASVAAAVLLYTVRQRLGPVPGGMPGA